MPKLVVTDSHRYPDGDFSAIEKVCREHGYELELLQCRTEDELAEQAADADGLLVIYSTIDDSLLSRLPKCRIVVRFGIGIDTLDLAALTKHGVVACNVPDYGVEEVAVHALGLILATERKIPFFDRKIRGGEWNDSLGYPMRRISQRTLGFLGFGRIARKLAGFCRPLGYRMVAYDPFLPEEAFAEAGAERVDLKEVFRQSDTMAVMAPLTPETHHVVNDDNLALCKDGLRIVNTARGGLIDTQAVIRGVRSGRVAAVGLDVIEEEPLNDPEHELLKLDGVIVTPHTAYQSVESFSALKRMTAETAVCFLNGDTPYNVVNPDVLNSLKG